MRDNALLTQTRGARHNEPFPASRVVEAAYLDRWSFTRKSLGRLERGKPCLLSFREVERRCKLKPVEVRRSVSASPFEQLEQ
jgi:hypothetical protein